LGCFKKLDFGYGIAHFLFSSIFYKCTCLTKDSCKIMLYENLNFHPSMQTRTSALILYIGNYSGSLQTIILKISVDNWELLWPPLIEQNSVVNTSASPSQSAPLLLPSLFHREQTRQSYSIHSSNLT
jgi:hypothetical protein